jgi:integrase
LIYNIGMSPTRGNPLPFEFTRALRKDGLERLKSGIFCDQFTQNLPMPTYTKTSKGVRAQICVKRIRKSKTFNSMGAARAWAVSQENEILAGERGEIPNKTFSDALDRYAEAVSAHKKGSKWEIVRINLIKRDRIAFVRLKDLDATHVSDWRDRRLLDVSGASVNREKNLLSHVCTIAVKEWKWLKVNPFFGVRMPPKGKPRTRLMTDDERVTLGEKATTEIYKEVLRMADFAVETGMRAGEICGLKEVSGRVAVLADTKNGERREVPLSDKALELWNLGPFTLDSKRLDVHWRNLCKAAGIDGLHFHDLRGVAATRLSQKLTPFQLARMFGWKDLKHAMIYYRETAEDVAKLL